jgi:hypothetical protein
VDSSLLHLWETAHSVDLLYTPKEKEMKNRNSNEETPPKFSWIHRVGSVHTDTSTCKYWIYFNVFHCPLLHISWCSKCGSPSIDFSFHIKWSESEHFANFIKIQTQVTVRLLSLTSLLESESFPYVTTN